MGCSPWGWGRGSPSCSWATAVVHVVSAGGRLGRTVGGDTPEPLRDQGGYHGIAAPSLAGSAMAVKLEIRTYATVEDCPSCDWYVSKTISIEAFD